MAAEAASDEALDRGLDVAAVHTQLIEPAMRSIGELWESSQVSVAVEHLATAISHEVAARVFWRALGAAPRLRERVMMAAVQGEQHVLGLRLAADVLEGAGYDVLYLGADVPLQALLDACRIHRPDVLGFTVSMSLHVPTMIWEIHEITHGS
jgi:methanogenic corrinoid protein MtbC1